MRETLDRVEIPPGGRILDVGCGTGILLTTLVRDRDGERLTGLDLSLGMLERARAKLGRAVGWVAGDAVRLPFRSEAFDLVLSLSALHHWPQPISALDEIRRVLRPGGRVAVTDWCGDRWTVRLRGRALGLFEPAHVHVYRTGELESLLAEAGFGWIRVERWRLDWSWELMTAVAARGDAESPPAGQAVEAAAPERPAPRVVP